MGKVKGTILVKVVRNIRAHRALARELLPQELQHYLDERILSTTWHDEEDYLALMKVVAKILPHPGIDVWEFMGRESAKVDFEDIYQSLVLPGDPTGTLKGFEAMWRLRHDSGRVKVTREGPGQAQVDLSDYTLVSDEICRSIAGHIWETLRQGGAQDIQLSKALCRAAGDEICRWRASWKP